MKRDPFKYDEDYFFNYVVNNKPVVVAALLDEYKNEIDSNKEKSKLLIEYLSSTPLLDIKQKDIAAILDVSNSTISKWKSRVTNNDSSLTLEETIDFINKYAVAPPTHPAKLSWASYAIVKQHLLSQEECIATFLNKYGYMLMNKQIEDLVSN